MNHPDATTTHDLAADRWCVLARQFWPEPKAWTPAGTWHWTIPAAELSALEMAREQGRIVTAQQRVGGEVRLLGKLSTGAKR